MSRPTVYMLKGRPVTAFAADGLPIHSRLSDPLRDSFRTRAQWARRGFEPDGDSRPCAMHPNPKTSDVERYYHRDDVTDVGHPFDWVPSDATYAPRLDFPDHTDYRDFPDLGLGVTACLNPDDGLPERARVPESTRSLLRTRKAWLCHGFVPKDGARAWQMHSQTGNTEVLAYFHLSEVSRLTERDAPRCCLTCRGRDPKDGVCARARRMVGERPACPDWRFMRTLIRVAGRDATVAVPSPERLASALTSIGERDLARAVLLRDCPEVSIEVLARVPRSALT